MEPEVIRLYAEGKKPAEIASVTGLSYTFIVKVLKANSVYDPNRDKRGPHGRDVVKGILPLADKLFGRYKAGERLIDIAGELGVSDSSLKKALREAGYDLLPNSVKRHRKGRFTVGPAEFIEVWQTSDTLDEVAERTGLHKAAVSSRAWIYRKKGIPLKKLKWPAHFDWGELGELAALLVE